MITAKVTFGNINASDHPVENVTTTTVSPNRGGVTSNNKRNQKQRGRESSIEAVNLNNHNRSSGSETSLLSENSSDALSSSAAAAATSQFGLQTTCVVDESVFKIPANYRCINYYANEIAAPMPSLPSAAAGAASTRPIPASHYHHYHRTNIADEDDILLQLAIQQSLRECQSGVESGEAVNPDDENLTALDVIAGSRQGGTFIY